MINHKLDWKTLGHYGRTCLIYLLIYALIFSPAIFSPAAFAVFQDETSSRLPSTADATYSFAAGDVDGDGDLDVLVANNGQSRLLINQGSGTFTDETAARLPLLNDATLDASLGDVDGDGDLDLVLANSASTNRLLINDGSGTFIDQTALRLPPAVQVSMDVELGDLDGDGDLDLVVANRDGQNWILLNDGSGVFADATAGRLAPDSDPSYAIKLADVNGDGSLDLLVVNHGAQNRLYFNNGAGLFTDVTADRLPASLAESIDAAFADLDGDGDFDLLVAQGADGLRLWLNDGSGTFADESAVRLPILGDFSIKVAVGDLDLDGDLDAVVANAGQDRVLLNDGSGRFSDATASLLPADDRRSFGAALLDADRDLDLDLLLATPGGQNRLLVNDILVAVPNVVGLTQVAAEAAIMAAGLIVGMTTTAHSVTIPAGHVINQNPAAGASVATGSAVDLVVSLGPAMVLVPDVVGLAQTAAEAAIVAAGLTVGMITPANSATVPVGQVISQNPAAGASVPEGSPVALVVSVGPATLLSIAVTPADPTLARGLTQQYTATGTFSDGSTQDLTSAVIWRSTDPAVAGIAASGLATASDAGTATIQAILGRVTGGTSLTVAAASLASIVLAPASSILLVGQTQAFTATGVLTDGTSQSLAGLVTWTSSAPTVASITAAGVATGAAAGSATISATKDGITGSTTLTVHARVTDTTPPTVAITAPAKNATLTGPTEIVGTATDANFLKYVLEITPAGQTTFTTLTTGTAPVVNGVLGTLDPTLLLNDLYTLRLTLFDQGGNTAFTSTTVQVARDQKVGNFSIAFQDLNIPLSGLPITVTRTYDSRDKGRGDFGIGWRLDIQTLRIRANRVQGTGWQVNLSGGFFPTYTLVGTDEHKVSLTLPDGQVEEFDLTPTPSSQLLYPFFSVTAAYTPRSGTLGTLVPLGETELLVVGDQPGTVDLTDFSFNTYDPQTFQYTFADGRVIVINKTAGVQSIREPNGNSLTFGPNGITHSSGQGITFVRDPQGRITQMTDPNGNLQRYAYDANGDLISHTDPLGSTTRFYYNLSHGLIEIKDPRGISPARNLYDDAGRLIAHIDANGNRIDYTHNVGARQEIVRDRRGNITVFNYDAAGNVLSETDPLGNTTTFTYDARGNKLSETDPLGNTTTFTYDARNNLLTKTDPLGNTISLTYNARNQILTTTDSLGRTVTNTYDVKGNLLKITDPLGNVTTHTYDAGGNLTSIVDSLGNTTTNAYDGFGNLIRQTNPLGHVTTSTYDANGNRLTETTTRTDALGNSVTMTTTHVYDGKNRLVQTTDPLGNVSRTEYNAIGKQSATIDKNGNRTTFEYDPMGHLFKTTYPDGTTEAVTYDADGNRLSFTDRAGRVTRYEYDALNRRTRTIFPDGSSTSAEYGPLSTETTDTGDTEIDSAGRVAATIDENGNRTSFEYDAAGRNTRVIDALGNATTFAYDANGNRVSSTDARGNTTTFQYDANNRLIKTVFPDGAFSTVAYDSAGRKIAETDEAGNTTTFQYNAVGRLTQVTDALGNVTRFAYDEVGNRISQTDALGNVTHFAYDSVGRLLTQTLPLGQVETRTYDAMGNLTTVRDFNGRITTNTYDSMGRLLQRTLPEGEALVYTYTPTGQTQTITDSRGLTRFTYDLRDRVVQVQNPDGTELRYTYDAKGNRTSVTTPGGTTTYEYDANNRLVALTDPQGLRTTFTYDVVGNRMGIGYPKGIVSTFAYDTRNRLTGITQNKEGVTIRSYAYTVGPTGNRTRVVENTGRTVDYTYDALFRLTEERISDPVTGLTVFSYAYDAVGNRISKTEPAGTTLYAYDANNRLVSAGAIGFTYDDNGNLLSQTGASGVTTFGYDGLNHLVRTTSPTGAVTQYVYDGLGNRLQRIDPAGTTHYLVDPFGAGGLAQVLRETDEAGAALADYVYGDHLISMTRPSGGVSFFLHDGQMSTRLLASEGGTVTDSYDYDAFGSLLERTGGTPNQYLYNSQQLDPNLGFYYLRARYYDPAIGRFTEPDPFPGILFDPLSLHPYIYARNDPVNRSDPSGLFFSLAEVSIANSIRTQLMSMQLSAGLMLMDLAMGGDEDAILVGLAFAAAIPILGMAARLLVRAFSRPAKALLRQGGWLGYHEGHTLGHTIWKHVGRSDTELQMRLIRETNLTGSSSFFSESIAEKVILKTTGHHRDKIKKWIQKGMKSPLNLYYSSNTAEIIGRGVNRVDMIVRDKINAMVTLKPKPGGKGYFVWRAFPAD